MPLYTRDWLDDAALRRCSEAARGLLSDMMCLMHEGKPYGYLTDERGEPLSEKFITSRLMIKPAVYRKLIGELEKESRLHRTESGLVYCRRMVKDEELRLRRSRGGSLGGNPTLKVNGEVNHEVKQKDNTGPRACALRAETENKVFSKKSLLDDFQTFQEAAVGCQLSGSEDDWADARYVWSRLDFEHKILAVKGLQDRKSSGEFDDPAFRPLVHNYLKKKVWQRPIRASPASRQEPKSYPREMLRD